MESDWLLVYPIALGGQPCLGDVFGNHMAVSDPVPRAYVPSVTCSLLSLLSGAFSLGA